MGTSREWQTTDGLRSLGVDATRKEEERKTEI
jgi:hypothetical protein